MSAADLMVVERETRIAIKRGRHTVAYLQIAPDDMELATLFAAAEALLALAHQYARDCGDCAGARICPDDSPCEQCTDIWAVIDRAEGRS